MRKLSLLVLLCVVACAEQYKTVRYQSHLEPEALLDYSSEQVSFPVNNPAELKEIASWVNNDQPSRADLACIKEEIGCKEAARVLYNYRVPFRYVPVGSMGKNVALIYDRISARDCSYHYTDQQSKTARNDAPFGCAVSANMLNMVGDLRQFTKPATMAMPDAEKAIQIYNTTYLE